MCKGWGMHEGKKKKKKRGLKKEQKGGEQRVLRVVPWSVSGGKVRLTV